MSATVLQIMGWLAVTYGLHQMNEILGLGFALFSMVRFFDNSTIKIRESIERDHQLRHKELLAELASLKSEVESISIKL